MTLAEKILAVHAGRGKVTPGEFINARVDLVLANDVTAPLAIKEFRRLGVRRVFDRQKVVMVPDHFAPNKDILSAEQAKLMREFALEQGLVYFEPQGDERVNPVIGQRYYQCVVPKPGYRYVEPAFDDTILDILVIW